MIPSVFSSRLKTDSKDDWGRVRCTIPIISSASFTYQKTDSEKNRIGMSSIVFDWFENRTHNKIDVRFCSITEPNRTIGVRLGSIDFWFDFVRLDTPGLGRLARKTARGLLHTCIPPLIFRSPFLALRCRTPEASGNRGCAYPRLSNLSVSHKLYDYRPTRPVTMTKFDIK